MESNTVADKDKKKKIAQKEIQEKLKELENYVKEGKQEKDAKVKALQEWIRAAMDIPQECWISKDSQLKDLIASLQSKLDITQDSTVSNEWISDVDVLKHASGGLALEGVYATESLEEVLRKREQLVEIHNSFTLTGAEQDVKFEQMEFSSHHSERVYHKVMERLGSSFSTALNFGFKAFGFSFGSEKTYLEETEETSSNTKDQSYMLNTKCHYIPQASGYLKKENIRLAPGPLKELQCIEAVISASDDGVQSTNRIKSFFEQFGSHVNKGPMHFGGVYWWKASVSGFKSTDVSEVKKMTSESLDIYCGASYGFGPLSVSGKAETSSSKVKGNFTGKYKEDLITQLELSISKTGGPAEIDDHYLWKSQLAASNRTWSVIDRGRDFIPVWEILLTSHRDDFVNVSELSGTLREVYTKVTGKTVEDTWGENILSELDKADALLQSMKGWGATDSEPHLIHLVRVKNDIFERTGSNKMWVQKYLKSEVLQNYLFNVAEVNRTSACENLKVLMRSLVHSIDIYGVGNFPQRKAIVEWAYQTNPKPNKPVSPVLELADMERILQRVETELREISLISAEDEQRVKEDVTKTVTNSLNSFCKTLREQDQKDAELIVLSIITVLGYCTEKKRFNQLLGKNDIIFMKLELQKAFSRYISLRRENATQAQAYLVLTALTVSIDNDVPIESKVKQERLNLIKSQLKEKLSKPIETAIQENYNDWNALEGVLDSIQKGNLPPDETVTVQVYNQIQNIMSKPLAPMSEFAKRNEDSHILEKGENAKFLGLLQKLGLQSFFPQKLTKAEVLTIDKLSLSLAGPKMENNLCSLSLYKLMMLDYRARYLIMEPEATPVNFQEVSESSGKDDDDFFFFETKSSSTTCSQKTRIHPMDLQMAIFHCSNDFLRQYIFSKLSICQFSLPFLVPNPHTEELEFPLWALRQIRKTWHSKIHTESSSTQGKYHNKVMYDTPVPVVSFMRLGDSEFNSKSQILNSVISRQRHNAFFHRHCEGSTADSLLMNGVVDIAWHCPGGREDDLFDDCLAFLNLHGDLENYPKQLDFLQSITTVNVLLLSEQPMSGAAKDICKRLSKSPVPLICLFSGMDTIDQSSIPTKVRIAAKGRNQAELTKQLITSIKQCISKNKKTSTIKACCEEARKHKFIVDVDRPSCKDGLAQAEILVCLLSDVEVSNLKRNVLPLQGDLWHDWCKKDKELYRLQTNDKESIEQQQSRILAEMTSIRKRQYSKANPLNDFIRSFLECLTTAVTSENACLYMLQWFVILLDDLASDELAILENKQQSTWRKMRSVRKDKEKIVDLLHNLDQINDQIANTTLGLQHIMREVSQLYEAAQALSQVEKNVRLFATLPKIAGRMLVCGYPLEIMDGDASHVPLTWIKAVFDELIKMIGDKKVFVLSILGLQSSGKSTLLNAMFGLQFAVSAGRCTRGAFMQLLKVDCSLQEELKYDYVLIVDTEGLRSPELNTKISVNHDNELATFIIGIGDATVINIMGENPSEMQDILQICVQAFLRMKQVKITPSCIFVHQNVAESSASDKNIEGRRRLLEKLDEMAQIAAREENIANITGFSDVIHFDIDAQVFYFKNLLEGDPPMAPPNPSYSQNVQELKMKILRVASWQDKRVFSRLSQFKSRLSDLWTALLQENFVFSFKNTVELMVYSALEKMYGEWSWELRKHSLKLQSELQNQIGSCVIQDVPRAYLMGKYHEIYAKLTSDIDKYFQEDKNKETLIKWQVNIKNRFQSLRNELIDGTAKKCKDLLTAKKNRSDLDKRKIQYTNELTEQSKRLASTLKTMKLTDEEVLEKFGELWINWTTEVLKSQPKEDKMNVRGTVECALISKFQNQQGIQGKVENFSQAKPFQFDSKKHINKNFLEKASDFFGLGKSPDHSVEVFLTRVTETVNNYISAKQNNTDFDVNFIHEILSNIEEQIQNFEDTPKNPKFTSEFKVELCVHHCLKNVNKFQMMHDDFQMANLPLTYLESQKDKYLQSFRNYCKGASSVKIFVDFLCQHICPEVLRVAEENVSQQTADSMKSTEPAFNGNRSKLENHILRDLATKQTFSMYEEYIDFPQRHFRRFIQGKVEDFTHDPKVLESKHQENLRSLKDQILTDSLTIATNESEASGNAKSWLDSFCRHIGRIGLITINRNELQDIENEEINDWQFFKDMMSETLEKMITKRKIDSKVSRDKVVEILFQQMEGCWAQCPFCGTICTNTIQNHDGQHSAKFHRCEALGGCFFEGTDNFSVDFCTTSVCSNKRFFAYKKNSWFDFKSYADAGDPYDKWSITADGSVQRYWKWFVCQFQTEWQNRYGFKFNGLGTIPKEWHAITKDSVLEELK